MKLPQMVANTQVVPPPLFRSDFPRSKKCVLTSACAVYAKCVFKLCIFCFTNSKKSFTPENSHSGHQSQSRVSKRISYRITLTQDDLLCRRPSEIREIIPTGDVYKVNVHLPALKGTFWSLLEPLNMPKTLEIRYGRKKVQLGVKNKKHAPEGSTVF